MFKLRRLHKLFLARFWGLIDTRLVHVYRDVDSEIVKMIFPVVGVYEVLSRRRGPLYIVCAFEAPVGVDEEFENEAISVPVVARDCLDAFLILDGLTFIAGKLSSHYLRMEF
jgi:hypothetical protein